MPHPTPPYSVSSQGLSHPINHSTLQNLMCSRDGTHQQPISTVDHPSSPQSSQGMSFSCCLALCSSFPQLQAAQGSPQRSTAGTVPNTGARAYLAQQLKVEELSYSCSLVFNQPFVLCSALPHCLLSLIIHF